MLGACALLAVQPLVRPHPGAPDRRGLGPATLAAAVYGGYFGAALGVMLLAVLGALTGEDLQRANALKAVLSLVIGAVAAVLLALFGPIDWDGGRHRRRRLARRRARGRRAGAARWTPRCCAGPSWRSASPWR